MAKLKYFGLKITNQNYIHEEIKSRLNSENPWYRSFRIVFLSHI